MKAKEAARVRRFRLAEDKAGRMILRAWHRKKGKAQLQVD